MNKRMILYVLGKLLRISGLLMIIPAFVGLLYQESEGIAYAIVSIILFIIGFLISRKVPKNKNIYAKEGFFIVAISWFLLSLFGALPFFITQEIPSYIDAFFETVSGFTTTGASILSDVEALSHASLFWRSFTHWVGGMGILVFAIAFMPETSGRSMHILKAEMPGPVVGKLVSKIKLTARILYIIYAVLTILQIVLLVLGDMPVFDSILNAFGTAGTGGFGIKNASIGAYNSAYIDGVITIFMILFGINFNLLYFVIIGKVVTALKSEELRWYLGIIGTAIIAITINIASMYESYLEAFRYASFQVASIITTTGYSTTDYDLWPMFSQTIILLLMFVGASSGSTGGGMKVSRIVMFGKNAIKELKKLIHPHSVVTVEFENQPVEPKMINNIHSYLILYAIVFVLSLLIITLENMDFQSTFSAVTTCLNNIGPGMNALGPTDNFSVLSDVSKVVLSFDMLAGRLEIFPVLIIFSKSFWKE